MRTQSKAAVKTGLDIIEENNFDILKGRKIGLVVNPASVNKRLEHAVDVFLKGKSFEIRALFGPQHGIYGNTQDNMIEWESFNDPLTGLPIHSLYGEHRKPTPEMLEGIDTLVVDLPDVGARYYTFVWTAKLCMEACAGKGIEMILLDRPNPISGQILEGPSLNPGYLSFVGLSPIIVRHGMTMGEMLLMINKRENIGCNLKIVKVEGWKRSMWFDETDLPWVLPSPNMPTLLTAAVYPGGCLLEATNISEARGTCLPFELMGAPWIDARQITEEMNKFNFPGAIFRPAYFQPTFNKHKGEICGGFQIHVTDRNIFPSVETTIKFIAAVKKLYPNSFAWKNPPYEYEYDKMPIDILWGDDELRNVVDSMGNVDELVEKMKRERDEFGGMRREFLLYT